MFIKSEVEYNGQKQIQYSGLAVLKSFNRIPIEEDKQRKNSNGRPYSVGTVEVEAPNGNVLPVMLNIYKGTWDAIAEEKRDFVIGEKYLVNLRPTPDKNNPERTLMFGTISHLQNELTDHEALAEAFGLTSGAVATSTEAVAATV